MYKFLRIIRPKTGTMLTVRAPIEFGMIDERIARMLNAFVDCDYPGFEITDMWTDDQKTMFESATVDN